MEKLCSRLISVTLEDGWCRPILFLDNFIIQCLTFVCNNSVSFGCILSSFYILREKTNKCVGRLIRNTFFFAQALKRAPERIARPTQTVRCQVVFVAGTTLKDKAVTLHVLPHLLNIPSFEDNVEKH